MERFAERYLLAGELGSGGYGTVYAAHDDNTGREIALKIFKVGIRPGVAFREAHVLAALEGPHILRMYDADVWNDIAHMSSAIAANRTAEDHLEPAGLTADKAALWTSHLLRGLDATHRRGLLHRDIKPANVFLDTHEHARLGDFGTTESLTDGVTPPEGDLRVRAPELFTPGYADARSDIYSVGVTLWRCLTKRWPFHAEAEIGAEEYGAWVLSGLPRRLRDVAPQVPAPLARIAERALALNPEDRFQSAQEMSAALGQLKVPKRWWQETRPHPDHSRCWYGVPTSGSGSHVTVCLRPVASRRYDIETRKAPSQNRIKDACVSVNTAALGAALRRILDQV